MPNIVRNGDHEGIHQVKGGIGKPSSHIRKPSIADMSPRSPLSPERRHRGSCPKNSIDLDSDNAWDMHSSDHSPSILSFGSNGDEPRIDSEIPNLVKVRTRLVERKIGGEASPRIGSPYNSFTPRKPDKASMSQLGPEALARSASKVRTPTSKPPVDRKNENPLRKQSSLNKSTNSSHGRSNSQNLSEFSPRAACSPRAALARPELAPLLLKQARDLMSLGDNPQKALESALQAVKLYEKITNNGKQSLDFVMSLHVTAAIYCYLGQHNQAISIIERSIVIPVIEEGLQHALAKFSGYMQLGDTYAMLGQLENSVMCYTSGLELQRHVLGDTDPRVCETCRYVAEANVQAFQLDEAERLCQMALDIHKANGLPPSLEEAADRRLMGLICETKGNHEAALEHLVLASMAMVANGQEVEVASVDCSIGDTFSSLARYDEAVMAYEKALKVYKANKGENHPAVGSVYVRLAELYNRTWKIKESKSYCEIALRIYENPMPDVPPEDIASGLTNISAIYESMNELEEALKLLHKALAILKGAAGQRSTIAGIEAQIGVLNYVLGNYSESYDAFKNATSNLRAAGEKKTAYFGIAVNQMGLACVQLGDLSEAAELFEEAKVILEQEYGPYHAETLGAYSNLAGSYDAVGRVDDAIDILEYIVDMREEKLGTANAEVVDEKRRLEELLKETGRVRVSKARSLEKLLDCNVGTLKKHLFI